MTSARTILTYGTFDLFHVGHLRLLERLAAMGDRLVVAVSTDAFNAEKGKSSLIPYEDRAAIVGALACVDEVIPEKSWDQKERDVRAVGAHVLAMGDDWQGKFDHLSHLCEVVYLPRTEGVSTTTIKGQLVPRSTELPDA
ncbi:adenylyltransferase/cytidyltransferase family protein [Qipengyuania sp. 1NDH17]|uniref:Adenylyltransferase/cytidyltransferase family protein n=1 Tax=Qipengyuania polymorpha TaxID=2867234 RepID=A0ABS7IXX3_9SPHN|nr:adenylyltransferase/cytidyltransferase family protein [Qipengyuania polymorpha]MBX7457889.1 adenylyltransferase/cytidyltransferase family protein [Qipengyuania polymorpha]